MAQCAFITNHNKQITFANVLLVYGVSLRCACLN